jgi:type IV pilus assembly protein PilY1
MKTTQLILAGLFSALLLNPIASRADDIDIYSGLTGSGNAPNMMFVIDSAANSDSNFGGTSCTYYDGSSPSLSGSKVLGNEQCALVNIVHSFPTSSSGAALVKVGITTANGLLLPLVPIDNNPYNGGAATTLTDITGNVITIPAGTTDRNAFILAAKNYAKRTGTTVQSNEMQETWAYYTGGNKGASGTTNNAGSITGKVFASGAGVAATSCQKNYILTIGSSPSAAHSHIVTDGPAPYDLATAVANDVANAFISTATQTAFMTAIPGNTEVQFTDEWARYMYQTDADHSASGTQNIISYAVILEGGNAGMDTFWQNVARYGGGKSFTVTDYTSIYNDILKILNEVQAVNSVFASSSLPVSVNAQGTFLNQIYMGMFRPDASGLPRWVGNLKQYQFGYDQTTQTLSLVDSLGNSAISGAGTGFISPNAVSFWTTKNTAVEPDLNGGFWRNAPQGAGLGYDSPDGELVEKGGGAQVLRHDNLLDDYTANPSSPRSVYTYCPSGSSCSPQLSNGANAFSTNNLPITAGMLGSVSTVNVSTLTRSGTVATVTTATPHNLIVGGTVTISGATQTEYNGSFTVVTTPSPSTTTFTINVPEYPPLLATGSYTASVPSSPQVILSSSVAGSITRGMNTAAVPNVATATVTMVANPLYTTSQLITITGAAQTKYNGLQTITVTGTKTFTFPVVVQPISPAGGATATASSNVSTKFHGVTTITLVTVSIVNPGGVVLGAETTAGTAPVKVTTTTVHGFAVGNTVTLANVVDSGGNAVSQYNGNFTIASVPSTTSFTYTTATTPPSPATIATGSTAITADFTASMPITSLVRYGTTATATTSVALVGFTAGLTVVSIGGTQGANEAGYVGSFTVTGVTGSPIPNTFTYTVPLTPATPATGAIKATGTGVVLDRTSLINWVRGQDNFMDEPSPDTTYTKINIRPSLHGDVLHSRPVVINYGGTIGVVVFYGSNDGVYHAINGNQTGTGAGSELWGFIPSEFIIKLSRMHDNSPVLKLASTPSGIVPTPQTKDYFVDGSTGVYQQMKADGTINKAYLYLAMRRGGQLLYALDVTTPADPKFLWSKSSSDPGFSELGQTWSQPKVASVKGYANPVLIFGAGYDTAEDNEPPTADSTGRGIFIVDAITGNLVWKAKYGATSACSVTTSGAWVCTVAGMNYSIPADITLMDRNDNVGFIDRLYAVDTGGNIWRVDLEPTAGNTPDKWQVTHLAALGCNTGACASGTTPRKFFYAADMVPTTSFDAVLIGSGDREHPLYTSASYNVTNRFYMVKDPNTGNDGSSLTTPLTEANLENITATTTPVTTLAYDGLLNGYYVTLGTGEKVVNAPLTVAGYTYFGTNTPATPSANSCTTNLGIAKGYRVSPLAGKTTYVTYDGGGLPPSPVAGAVAVIVNGKTMVLPFCIGCGGNPDCVGSDCKTAIGGGKPPISVSTSRSRTYWYKESD